MIRFLSCVPGHGRRRPLEVLRPQRRAAGSSRAVLRDASRSDGQSPRVVVAYPPGSVPPREKAPFARDARRPYRITEVRRGTDGAITIYVILGVR